MSFLSLTAPYVWFIFLELSTYLSCGVILINLVFTERIPKARHIVAVVGAMMVLMVPVVLIVSYATAYIQLFLLTALLFAYARIFMPGKLSGHLFWATVLVASGTVITLVIFSSGLKLCALLSLPSENIHYLAIIVVILTHVLITVPLARKRVIRHEESASSVLYLVVAFWFCACLAILITLSKGTSVLQTTQFLGKVDAAGTEDGMAFVNTAIVVTLVFELVYTQWVIRHDRRDFETSYANLAQGYIKNLDVVATELRGLRHDLRNHIIALSGLVQRKDLAAISVYLDRMQEAVGVSDTLVLTGNDAIDVVVSAKLEVARQKGIAVQTRISALGTVSVDNYSIAAILGNLLDNAIEASELFAKKGPGPGIPGPGIPGPGMVISIKRQRDNAVFSIKNTALAPQCRGDVYVSTKSEPSHGLGLIQIRRLVNDGNGHFETSFRPGESLILRESGESFDSLALPPQADADNSTKAPEQGVFTATVLLPMFPD